MPRVYSRHNILAAVPGTTTHVVANLLSGNADLLDAAEATALASAPATAAGALAERGYVVDPAEETGRLQRAYLDFVANRDRDEVQLFFAPSYACNFACAYCYQSDYGAEQASDPLAVVAAFFRYVDDVFRGRRTYLTLFGGEPLLPGPRQRAVIEALVDGAASRGLEVAVVTNGYTLTDYLDLLGRAKIREIQVTLDGVGALHDQRRPLKGGGPTFERVVAGIDAALARSLTVNLRVVADRDNLAGLVELARFARARGWTGRPNFKTQIGRNYELHYCQVESSRLYSRLELAGAYASLARQHPELLEFHRPAFGVAKTLADSGRLPDPLFDACPGTKTEWAFDYTGHIYACTATVGKPGEALGTFYPEVTLDQAQVDAWQERDVLSIGECTECPQALACGGGCAAVAKNRTGQLHAPDCRPVKELLGLGWSLYRPEETRHE